MMPGDPVVGSTILRRPAIQSPNFVTTVSGWTINADGSAEFNNLSIRGTFNGTDFIINSSGAFFYSSTPAAGNLIASIAPAAGTDASGNNYLAGSASYAATFATALNAGFVAFYGGSLAGGWTALSSVSGDVAGNLQVNAGGQLQLVGSGGVTVNGSSSTGVGDNGGVTSGPSGTVNAFPAAGPNHTHAELHHHPL
jgi:hypothetical protein